MFCAQSLPHRACHVILLQTYVKSQDKAFAAATIQAIGRCATNICEVTDTCLNGLVLLLSNRDGSSSCSSAQLPCCCGFLTPAVVSAETVVAESVVVIKKLLQTQPTQHSDIIKHMAKLFDNITVRVRVLAVRVHTSV